MPHLVPISPQWRMYCFCNPVSSAISVLSVQTEYTERWRLSTSRSLRLRGRLRRLSLHVRLDRGTGVTYIGGTSTLEGLRYARRIQEIHPAWQCCGYGGGRGDWRRVWRRGRFLDQRLTDAIYRGSFEVARLFES